jgi:pimeloyl-ACP methyl ester carboxylesterase
MLRVAGATPERLAQIHGTEIWSARLVAAHTILREAASANRNFPRSSHLNAIDVPARILVGTESPAWLRSAAQAVHTGIAGSELRVLEWQRHFAIDEAPAMFVESVLSFAPEEGAP